MSRPRALITGASSGIGAALARRLAGRGFDLWIAARREAALREREAELSALGATAHVIALDVSDPEATEATVARLDAQVGGFDLVIANAGTNGETAPARAQRLSEARRMLETNTLGAIATLMPPLAGMLARGRGQLVGVTSLAGEIALPAAVDYGVSKAALSFFLASLAVDVEPLGVSVTDVRPGFVRTDFVKKNKFEMPFIVEVERAAGIIDRGIFARRRVVRFPAPITTAITASSWMPTGLRSAILNKQRPV